MTRIIDVLEMTEKPTSIQRSIITRIPHIHTVIHNSEYISLSRIENQGVGAAVGLEDRGWAEFPTFVLGPAGDRYATTITASSVSVRRSWKRCYEADSLRSVAEKLFDESWWWPALPTRRRW
ncbi:hypothetical protein [Streptomyces canus]|uniref:hypothetical protein n=1 Tax=Streptomyces canus TaxID=58343 RepID=UPI0033AB8E48